MQAADEEVSQRNLTDSPRDAVMEEAGEEKPEESKVLDENRVEVTNEAAGAAAEEKSKGEVESKTT